MQDRAGEVTAFFAREEERGLGNIDRLADAFERRLAHHAVEVLALLEFLSHRSVDHAGSDRVAVYVVPAELERHVLHQHPDAGLADRVLARALDRDFRGARSDRDNAASAS